jgi:membrane-associated phospholipid phosphatase
MKQSGVWGLLLFLGLAGFASLALGQAKMQHPVHPAYLKSYFTDTRDVVVAPFRAPVSSWKKAGWAGVAVGGSLLLDRAISNALGTPAPSVFGLELAAGMGNGLITLPATGVMWGMGYWGGDEKVAATGLLAAKAFILSRLLVQLPKYAFQRQRPLDAGGNPFLFSGPFGGFTHDAFPSGHVTSAFAAAAVMRVAFREEHRWVPFLFYGMGVATATGRLVEGKHWFSDVVAGALFGHAVGHFLATRSNSKLQVTPGGLVYRF